jgi:hypothetical protein
MSDAAQPPPAAPPADLDLLAHNILQKLGGRSCRLCWWCCWWTAGSPAEFLKNVVGKEVKVRIGQGIDYQGEHFSYSLLA